MALWDKVKDGFENFSRNATADRTFATPGLRINVAVAESGSDSSSSREDVISVGVVGSSFNRYS